MDGFITTASTNKWFNDLKRDLTAIEDRGGDSISQIDKIESAIKKLRGLEIMLQREFAILPVVTNVTADAVAAFWRGKYAAYYAYKNSEEMRQKKAKELVDAMNQTGGGIYRMKDHISEFLNWILRKPHELAVYGEPPESPTTTKGVDAAWKAKLRGYKEFWGPVLIGNRDRALEGLEAWRKAVNSFLEVAMSLFGKDDDEETKKFVLWDLGIKLKRGEKLGRQEVVPRGGNVAGFALDNEIGVRQSTYALVARLLNSVRQILDRRGLSGATRNIPIVLRGLSSYPKKVHVAATGQNLPAAGLYYHEARVIAIMIRDEDVSGGTDSIQDFAPDMVGTILHEIGHYYYYNRLSAAAKAHHEKYFRNATSWPSSYARNNASEDWAELWTAYLGRQYYREGHQGYTLDNECWNRLKSTIAMDPRLKEISKMVAEAEEADWEASLLHEVSGNDVAWDARLGVYVSESRFDDFESNSTRMEGIVKSLHSLVKGGGFFKSEAQAKYLTSTSRQIAEKLPDPKRWYSAFDPAMHTALYTVSKIPWAGKSDVTKIRYSSHGFILDGQGVVMRLKFKVSVKPDNPHFGEVMFDTGTVDFQRPAGASSAINFDIAGDEAKRKREKEDRISKNQTLIAQIQSISGWAGMDILQSFVTQLQGGGTLSPKQLEIVNKYLRQTGLATMEQDWATWQSAVDFVVKLIHSVWPQARTLYNAERDKQMARYQDMRMGSYHPFDTMLWKDYPVDRAEQEYLRSLAAATSGKTSWEPSQMQWYVEYALEDASFSVFALKGMASYHLENLYKIATSIRKAREKKRVTKDGLTAIYDLIDACKHKGWRPST
jgi:hypothetical protein